MKTAITIFSAVVNPLKLSSDQSGGWTVAGGDGTTPAAAASSSTSRRPASISELPTRSTWASRCHSTFHTPLSMTSVVSVISPYQHTAVVFTAMTDVWWDFSRLTLCSPLLSYGSYKASCAGPGKRWMEQCFTSPPTQYRLYGRRFLQVNQQYQSTEGTHTVHQ